MPDLQASNNALPTRAVRRLDITLCLFGFVAFGLKAWTSLCLFPYYSWNDIRLRPSYLIADGQLLYPGLTQGLITTWIYGPAHPLLFLPVTFFRDIQSAYMAAAALNILQLVLAFAFICFLWPERSVDRPSVRSFTALAICLLIVPGTCFAVLQADNTALACGLVSITCLARHTAKPDRLALWGSAFFGVGAAFAKLHGTAVIAGELIWLLLCFGPKKLPPFLIRSAFCIAAWCLLTLPISSSLNAIFEHVVQLPSGLPWAEELIPKLVSLRSDFFLMVVLPALAVIILNRLKLLSQQSRLLSTVWIVSLPLGVLGAVKYYGSSNSLHGVYYLLPLFALELGSGDASPRHQSIVRKFSVIALFGLGSLQVFSSLQKFPSAPLLLHANQADELARTYGNKIWIPWRPLASYLATGKHYHDEDGLLSRQVTGFYPSRQHAMGRLPEQWSLTAISSTETTWGVSLGMQPVQGNLSYWGDWHLYSFGPSSK